MQQRIQELITKVPKETSEVRNEIIALGINRDKLKRWKSKPNAGIDAKDAIKLVDYFKKYSECGVSKVDDLFVPEKTASAIAAELKLTK